MTEIIPFKPGSGFFSSKSWIRIFDQIRRQLCYSPRSPDGLILPWSWGTGRSGRSPIRGISVKEYILSSDGISHHTQNALPIVQLYTDQVSCRRWQSTSRAGLFFSSPSCLVLSVSKLKINKNIYPCLCWSRRETALCYCGMAAAADCESVAFDGDWGT